MRVLGAQASRRLLNLRLALLIAGLGFAAWLVAWVGAPVIGSTLRIVGLRGVLAISAFHLIATALMGCAWWQLRRAGTPRLFIWARLVRDAGSEVLLLSQIGGYVLGARAAILGGVESALVIASSLVDTALEFCAQLAFIAIGIALLPLLFPNSRLVVPVAAGLCVAIVAAAAFLGFQRSGAGLLLRVLSRSMRRFDGLAAIAPAVDTELRRIHRARWRLAQCCFLHLCAWIITGIEGWLGLRLMGASFGVGTVLVIESMIYASRALGFLVPGALGVQEGSYIIVGAALGLPPELALSLSLLKRARDLCTGIPALISWHFCEIRAQPRRSAASAIAAVEPRDEPRDSDAARPPSARVE